MAAIALITRAHANYVAAVVALVGLSGCAGPNPEQILRIECVLDHMNEMLEVPYGVEPLQYTRYVMSFPGDDQTPSASALIPCGQHELGSGDDQDRCADDCRLLLGKVLEAT